MTDISKIKSGDEVTVKIKVHDISGNAVIFANENNEFFGLNVKDIVTHTPQPREFKVGDLVRHVMGSYTYTYSILAIHDKCAFIKSNEGGYNTAFLTQIRHVDLTDQTRGLNRSCARQPFSPAPLT